MVASKYKHEPAEMTIGRLAKVAGVSVETIRYYERCGLLRRPRRPGRAYRRYPDAMVEHIGFIKCAQSLGFTLQQIRQLLELDRGRAREADATAAFLLKEVQRRVVYLKALESALRTRTRSRRGNRRNVPILGALKQEANRKA